MHGLVTVALHPPGVEHMRVGEPVAGAMHVPVACAPLLVCGQETVGSTIAGHLFPDRRPPQRRVSNQIKSIRMHEPEASDPAHVALG